MIHVEVIHDDYPNQRWPCSLSPDITLENGLLNKLHLMTGSSTESMTIYLKVQDKEHQIYPNQKLGSLISSSDVNNLIIRVVDRDPNSIGKLLQDDKNCKKFVLPDEVYAKRKDTARKWIQTLKASRPELFKDESDDENETMSPNELVNELRKTVKIGDRCETATGGCRGEIKWIGILDTPKGSYGYVGALLDEPLGDCDGTYCGTRLFECEGRRGQLFRVREKGGLPIICGLAVGDYPIKDPFESEPEEEY